MRSVKILVLLVSLCVIGGCAWMPWLGSAPAPGRGTPADLYRAGLEYYQAGKYNKAITQFTRLREEYPLSQYATLAEMGVADSHYSAKDYLMAEATYREFMAMRPTNENIPYVMYQIGMCSFNQMLGVDRDQMRTRMAKDDFESLLARFPSSRFSFMAEQKLRDCLKRLGEHEFYVGHFYYKQGEYEAALRRFETIQQQYPNLGLDYKVSYFLNETRRKLAEKSDA